MSKIKAKEELAGIIKGLKSQGKKVVTTNGVFDILHIGHLHSFMQAKSFGDVLVVGLNSDKSVKTCLSHEGIGKKKIIERPVFPEHERAKMVAALDPVDFVMIFDEPDPKAMLEAIKPDFHVKGRDWEGKRIPEMDVLDSYGGEMRYIDLVPEHSTTRVIGKIVKAYLDKKQ